VRFLLLQARAPGDAALQQERLAFAETLGDVADLEFWDLLGGPPPLDVVDGCDAVLAGGSGEFGVGDAAEVRWLAQFIDFSAELAGRSTPAFFSCFGFQALVVAAGGRVETDRSRAEAGTFYVRLTEAGERDRLFGLLAPGFYVQLGHKDHAVEIPSGLVHLASSDRSPHQALAVEGKRIYATQFHPELSMARNRERFDTYRDHYERPDLPDTPEAILASFRETPESSSLLRSFAEAIVPTAGG
jgi:GMP synthase (glutamine-hydrolysing)